MRRTRALTLSIAMVLVGIAASCEEPPPDPDPTTTTTETTATTVEETTTTTEPEPTTSSTTTTTEPPADPIPVGDTYARTAFPHDATTGPEVIGLDESNLPMCRPSNPTGLWSISAPTTVEGCRHEGRITVKSTAAGTVLRGLVVEAAAGGSPVILNESSELLVEASVIGGRPGNLGPQGQECGAGIAYGRYTVRTTEIQDCADGIKLTGSVTVQESFIHGLARTCGTDGCTHNDGAQRNDNTPGEVQLTMTGSAVYMYSCTSNRIVQAPSLGQGSTFDMRGNFFYGSHGLLNIDKEATSAVTGNVEANTFAGSVTAGPFSADAGHTSPGLYTGAGVANIDRTGNVFESGEPVPTDGQMDPYACAAMPPAG